MAKGKLVQVVDADAANTAAVEALLQKMNLPSAVYRSGDQFLEMFDLEQPGCVILSVGLPGVNGLQVQQKLIAQEAPQPLIFLTQLGDLAIAVRAIRAGAFHYMEQPFREHELWAAITEAIRLDEVRRDRLLRRRRARELFNRLSPAERQVAELLIHGRDSAEIAEAVGVSVRTVELRRSEVSRKLGSKRIGNLLQMFWILKNWEDPYVCHEVPPPTLVDAN